MTEHESGKCMKTHLRHGKINILVLDYGSNPAKEPNRVEISSYSLHLKREIEPISRNMRLLKILE
jgi:hypothetical protein